MSEFWQGFVAGAVAAPFIILALLIVMTAVSIYKNGLPFAH